MADEPKQRYRKVSTFIWNDDHFRSYSDKGKLAFLFLLTHPAMTSLGAMRASIPGLAAELGWTEKGFREALREAFREGKVEADEKACLIVLRNFLKHNRPESANVVISWAKWIDELPHCELLAKHLQRVKGFTEGLGEGFAKAYGKALAKAMPIPQLFTPTLTLSKKEGSPCDSDEPPAPPSGPSPVKDLASDPLASFPTLQVKAPEIIKAVSRHGNGKPKKLTAAQDANARKALAKLAKDYSESDIVACLRWMITGKDDEAAFWNPIVRSLPGLVVSKEGVTKWETMFAQWQRATGQKQRESFRDRVVDYYNKVRNTTTWATALDSIPRQSDADEQEYRELKREAQKGVEAAQRKRARDAAPRDPDPDTSIAGVVAQLTGGNGDAAA